MECMLLPDYWQLPLTRCTSPAARADTRTSPGTSMSSAKRISTRTIPRFNIRDNSAQLSLEKARESQSVIEISFDGEHSYREANRREACGSTNGFGGETGTCGSPLLPVGRGTSPGAKPSSSRMRMHHRKSGAKTPMRHLPRDFTATSAVFHTILQPGQSQVGGRGTRPRKDRLCCHPFQQESSCAHRA